AVILGEVIENPGNSEPDDDCNFEGNVEGGKKQVERNREDREIIAHSGLNVESKLAQGESNQKDEEAQTEVSEQQEHLVGSGRNVNAQVQTITGKSSEMDLHSNERTQLNSEVGSSNSNNESSLDRLRNVLKE